MAEKPAKITHRREVILRLLDHLPDYEPGPQVAGAVGGGSEPPRMPQVFWEPSVQELYRCLARLQLEERGFLSDKPHALGSTVHAHLTAFYHSEWRIVRPKPKRRVLRGQVELVEPKPNTWRRERIVSAWIILPLKDRGVDYVVDGFRGEPFLPEQILKAA